MTNLSPPTVEPLVEPPVAVAPACKLERWCWYFPFVGWTVAGVLERERRTPRWDHIAHQLQTRTRDALDLWGDDRLRRSLAQAVARVIRDEFGWPNAHFIPDDRLDLLMYSAGNGLSPVACAFTLEKILVVTLGGVTCRWQNLTLGQLVDHILSLPRKCPTCGYDLRASPERCPECGTEVVI